MLSLRLIMENVAEKHKSSGSMIAFFIPTDIGIKFQSIFKDVPGDKVLPRDEHITLLLLHNTFGNEKKILSIIEKVAENYKPIMVDVDSFELFSPTIYSDNKYVLYAKPKCPELQAIHKDLKLLCDKNKIKADNGNFEFSPHITIKYCETKPNLDQKINISFTIDKLAFAIGEKHYFINLG